MLWANMTSKDQIVAAHQETGLRLRPIKAFRGWSMRLNVGLVFVQWCNSVFAAEVHRYQRKSNSSNVINCRAQLVSGQIIQVPLTCVLCHPQLAVDQGSTRL